jgi:hypothetical protein
MHTPHELTMHAAAIERPTYFVERRLWPRLTAAIDGGHPEYDLALIEHFEPMPEAVFDGYRELAPKSDTAARLSVCASLADRSYASRSDLL